MNRTQSCSSRLHVVCLRNGTASGNCGSVRQPFPALSALMKLVFTTFCSCCCCVASIVSDSVRPHRRQPTRLLRPWDSPGKNTGVGCHFLLQCMKVKSESEVAQSSPTLSDPMDCSLLEPAKTSVLSFSSHPGKTATYWSHLRSPPQCHPYRALLPFPVALGNEWLTTSVFLPEKSQVQRSLVGYTPWGRKKLD